MTKLFARWVVPAVLVIAFAGVAFADSTTAGSAAGSATGSAAPVDAPPPATPPPVPAVTPSSASDARKACTAAMNADPKFAAAIVKVADEKAAALRDQQTLDAHNDAFHHIQKNEQHVIYGYAAMWIVAALFVLFLWRRQQALTAEIASLRRDLEAAAEDAPKGSA